MTASTVPVGVFCPTFLQPEMLHVYRQVTELERVCPVILAFKRRNADLFPNPECVILRRSRWRWLRRIWQSQLRRQPQRAFPSEVLALEQALEQHLCELLHIYLGNNGVFWLPALRRLRLPTIVSFHGADVQLGLSSKPGREWLRRVFQSATLCLARSDSLAGLLVRLGCPPTHIRVQRTGIPLATYRFAERATPLQGEWHLLQAARLIPKKGLEVTIRAFAKFRKEWPLARLTVAGDGPLRASLEALASRLSLTPAVRFAGFLSPAALLDLYYDSHIFLHPSETTPDQDREGIPNSLLEAMATGLPCVATRHGGIPEAIESEKSGLLISEGDSAGVVEALRRLAKDQALRTRIGKAAAERVQAEFDLVKQRTSLEDIYLRLIAESRSGAI